MNSTITILDWDTNFFEKKIGRIDSIIHSEGEMLNLTFELLKQNIDLAYYHAEFPLSHTLLVSDRYSITLVDKKTTYKKSIGQDLLYNASVIEYENDYPEQKLLDLSVESGVYSRFKVDEKIGKSKFEELYRTWIINSVSKKIAKEVLVYKTNEIIAGFVTLGEKKLRADIGIIAVDAHYRGNGIGKSLMFAAENWFLKHSDYKEIQVVTQGANIPACKLYESCGYVVDKVEYCYHLWKKGNTSQ